MRIKAQDFFLEFLEKWDKRVSRLMILTVTLNPAIDIVYKLDELKIDSTNRVLTTKKSAGGKGLNIARVIYQMKER